jgi:hypothetical protein
MRCSTPGKVSSASAIAASRTPIARAAAVAAAAFSRLWAPGIRGSAGSASSTANSTRRAPPGKGAEAARHDGDVAVGLALEDPKLRPLVRCEVAVTIEVVGLEIREDGDAWAQRLDVFELEGRELAHDPGVGLDGTDQRRQRATDVARDLHGHAPGLEHRAEQGRGRRLPVRSGDPGERIREQACAQLDLRDHRDRPTARRRHRRSLRRNPRALHDELHALQQRRIPRPEYDLAANGRGVHRPVGVVGDHLDAALGEGGGRRAARARKADHEDAPGDLAHDRQGMRLARIAPARPHARRAGQVRDRGGRFPLQRPRARPCTRRRTTSGSSPRPVPQQCSRRRGS